jgi:hypothetical protein
MNGYLWRTGQTGAWVVFALCALTACNAAPESHAPAASAGATSVAQAVRVATDRSGMQQEVITLPSGERMRRVSLRSGFNHVLVGRVGPDGMPTITCVDSAPAAEAFLAGGSAGAGQ